MNRRASGPYGRGFVDAIAVRRIRRTAERISECRIGNCRRREPNKRGHLVGKDVAPGRSSIVRAINAFTRSFRELRLGSRENQLRIGRMDRDVADSSAAEREETERSHVIVRSDK